jgi:hypothetical protein
MQTDLARLFGFFITVLTCAMAAPGGLAVAADADTTATVPASQALLLPASPVAEPAATAGHERFVLDALFEDDGAVPLSPTDRHYSAGERLVLAYWPQWADDLAAVFPLHRQFETSRDGDPIQPRTAAGFFMGQDIYTPDHINEPALRDAWPYAGWLYVGGFWQRASDLRLDHVEFQLGTTGQSALAGDAQSFVHTNIGGDKPIGWDRQLPGEVGFNCQFSRRWDFDLYQDHAGWGLDVIPEADTTLGTVNREASLGGMVRWGWRLPHDFGPGQIHNLSAYTLPRRRTSFYLFLGGSGRYVERNWFLDGPNWRTAPHPGSMPWVAEGRAGFGLDLGEHWRITYGLTELSRQMRGPCGHDAYGTISVSYIFHW